jgi:hypothetical protein
VLKAVRSPEIARVCEEIERSSKCLVEAAQRTAAIRDLLADLDLPLFEPADAVLVSRDDRLQLRLRDPVRKLIDVAFDLRELEDAAAPDRQGAREQLTRMEIKRVIGARRRII